MCSNCAGDYQDPDHTAPNEEEVRQMREQLISSIPRRYAPICAVPDCIRVARVQCDICNAMVCKEHIHHRDPFPDYGPETFYCELCDAEWSA
ncbi:MAG: hypothetical protein ACRD2L_16225 [Terriglobia bacterium]